jgi:hypothetical protein
MMKRVLSSKDLFAGLLFIVFGAVVVKVAVKYRIGTAARMGPGYLPIVLGGLLILLGIVIAARALWMSGDTAEAWGLRPLLLVIGAVLAFGFLVDWVGLVLTIPVLVVISRLAGSEFHVFEVFLLCLVLVLLALGIFVYGLNLPFKIWPSQWMSSII